jgi:hypothetical protein
MTKAHGLPVRLFLRPRFDPSRTELTADYGFMVLNLGSEDRPMPLYRLASCATGNTQNFDALTARTTAFRETSVAQYSPTLRQVPCAEILGR